MNNFQYDESGAVTVDWVVLTAALVGLGLAVAGVVSVGVEDVSTDIKEQLHSDGIIRTSFGPSVLTVDAITQLSPHTSRNCPFVGQPDPNLSLSEQGCSMVYVGNSYNYDLSDGNTYRVMVTDWYNEDGSLNYHGFSYGIVVDGSVQPLTAQDAPAELVALEADHVPFDPLDFYPNGI